MSFAQLTRRISLILFLLTVAAVSSFAQGVRFDNIAVSVQSPSSVQAVVVRNPVIHVCDGTAGVVTDIASCAAHPVSTYTSATLGTACGPTVPIVLTNTSTCVAQGDNYGNFGFWVPAGTVKFSVTGTGAIPQLFTLTANGGGTGGATIKVNGVTSANQAILNLVAGANISLSDDGAGNITIAGNPTTGVALLQPPSSQTTQGTASTVQLINTCPAGALGSLLCFRWLKSDGSNILSLSQNGDVAFGDGITGHWTAAYFGHSTGTLATVGVLRLANTDIGMAWRNNAGSGDASISKDNSDVLHMDGFANIKFGTSYLMKAAATVSGRPVVASSTTGDTFSSQIFVDASWIGFIGTDDCDTIHNAVISAATLGQDVDARGFTGALNTNNFTCDTQEISDTFAGKILYPPGIIWIKSPAGSVSIPSRNDLIGVGVGRGLGGPASGTIFKACNEASGTAQHSVACQGATFNPNSGFCTDGVGGAINCPLMGWALYSNHFAPTQLSFDSHVKELAIDCNFVANCVALQNGMQPPVPPGVGGCNGKCGGQENTGPWNVRIDNWGVGNGRALRWMLGSQNSDIEKMNLINNQVGSIADCSGAIAMEVTATGTGNGPKHIGDITNTNTGCAIDPATSLKLDASQVNVEGYHCEQVSGQCGDFAKDQDVKGVDVTNMNGVDNSGAVVHIEAGHAFGGFFHDILNVNGNGYVIKDDIHSVNLRVPGPEGSNLISYYGFDYGTTGVDDIQSSSGAVPKSFTGSAQWTSNVNLAAGDCVKIVPGSDHVLTICGVGEADAGIGFSRTAITDPASNVEVVSFGYLNQILTATNTCADRDYIYSDTVTAGKILCSTVRPTNTRTYGWVYKGGAAAAKIDAFVIIQGPAQPVSQCTQTAGNPLNCAAFTTGLNSFAFGCSAAACLVNTTYVKATSMIFITRTSQLGASCDVAEVETAASPVPVGAVIAGTSFAVNVPTLTAAKQFCFSWRIINP